MTQANETNSRIARLEALILEIAAANLRHDRDNDRQDDAISSINATLDRVAEQQAQAIARHGQWQAAHEQRIAEHEEWQRQHEAAIARHEQWQAEQDERIATLTASIQELRNLVSDYIQSRSTLEQ